MYCPLVLFLLTEFIFIWQMVWLQMNLSFSVLYPLLGCYQVTSGSWHNLVMVAGYHLLSLGSWYMTTWFKCRSCDGTCSFLDLFLNCSQSSPFCFLATLDIDKLDLADLLARICMGNCKLLDKGVLQ